MAKIGHGVSKTEVPSLVKYVLDKAEVESYVIENNKKLKDNLPSSSRLYAFLNRYKLFLREFN